MAAARSADSPSPEGHPFGGPRGAANQLPGERGFLGQTQDSATSLVYLNARYYSHGGEMAAMRKCYTHEKREQFMSKPALVASWIALVLCIGLVFAALSPSSLAEWMPILLPAAMGLPLWYLITHRWTTVVAVTWVGLCVLFGLGVGLGYQGDWQTQAGWGSFWACAAFSTGWVLRRRAPVAN